MFEHPGEDTVPTSIFVCDTGGMVVICAGTTGYNAMVDLRYHWMRQKRLQGSHGTNDEQATPTTISSAPARSTRAMARVLPSTKSDEAHQEMDEGKHGFGTPHSLSLARRRPGSARKPDARGGSSLMS